MAQELGLLRRVAIAAALAAIAVACSPQSSGAASAKAARQDARHAESGLPVIPLSVTHDGTRRAFQVEVASTGAEQARGLMFRTKMGADEGMIFPMSPPRTASFWMKNTVMPLDIIFIGTDRRILNIAANTTPYSLDPVPSAGLTSAVLELNGGRAAELGLAPGDLVEW